MEINNISVRKLSPEEAWTEYFSESNIKDIFRKNIFLKGGQGVDRISVKKFNEDLDKHAVLISRKCISGGYKFSPYLEFLQSKGRGKNPRVVSIPTVRDKIVLKILTNYLHYFFEDYIAKDLPNTVVRKMKESVLKHSDESCYIKIDLKTFFDSIPHDKLIKKLKSNNNHVPFLCLVKRALVNPTLSADYSLEQRKQTKNTKGVAQGLSISNILAEIYAHDLDDKIKPLTLAYFRFVDDVFVLCRMEEGKEIWKEILKTIHDLGLEMNVVKSTQENTVLSIQDGFEFLGYKFKENVFSVRESSYRRYVDSLIGKITKFRHDKKQKKKIFIAQLNERITGAIDNNKKYGWIFFFSEIDDLELLKRIDRIIMDNLKRIEGFEVEDFKEIKKVFRSYFEARFSPKRGYIHNYNEYTTVDSKLKYLVDFGYLPDDKDKSYTDDDIILRFEQAKAKNLLKLERDVSNLS